MRIGIAQVPQTSDIVVNLDKAIEFVDLAAAQDVDLLCFPETHLPGYRVGILAPDAPCESERLAVALDALAARCGDRGIGVCVGTETPNGALKPFNSAVVIDRDGAVIATHHKSRLTPQDTLGYTPGEGPTLFEFDGVAMGLVICFEGFRFPETSRELAQRGAKVILHPQFNHVLPDADWKQPVQEALITARAAENTAWFVSANMAHERNNCRSLVVAPNGLVAAASELRREMLVTADVDPALATHAVLSRDPDELMRVLAER
jgi:predicted amidohydrolase